MKTFSYHAPTGVCLEENCLESQKNTIISYGRRAFIITSKFCGDCKNLALEDITGLFDQFGITYAVSEDVVENPTVESVKQITELVRAFAPEFIVAIGGGSALDTAKATNVLLKYPSTADAYEVFYSGDSCKMGCNCGLLPLLGIPTTVGSGSEVMGFAVLTRADTQTKMAMRQYSFFDASFLDSKYVANAPQWLLDSGTMDALCHGIEGWLNRVNQRHIRLWQEYGLELFASIKDHLLDCCLTCDDCGTMMVSASIQGMALLHGSTLIPHGMGYPLTHFKGVSHGLASCMTMPAYLASLKDRSEAKRLVSDCGFADLDEFSAYIGAIIDRNVQFSVSRQEIDTWTEQCFTLKDRLERSPEPVTKELIRSIYMDSLKKYIVD